MPLEVETLLLPEENDILLNDVSEVSLKCIEDELGVNSLFIPSMGSSVVLVVGCGFVWC